jgi:lipopolysaccharide/colanic/teichoic acid biosynthesis glycosyltransferase
MYKFRSMVEGADKLRPALEMANEAEGVLFKIEADPRITPIGLWIRRWSIDEIPQLINVLKGEMNLVGPRPLPVDDIQRLGENVELQYWFTQRSKVKPGITGTWQVSNRDSLKMEDMVRLDIDYIQHWNFFSDLAILIRTIPAVFKGRGAR